MEKFEHNCKVCDGKVTIDKWVILGEKYACPKCKAVHTIEKPRDGEKMTFSLVVHPVSGKETQKAKEYRVFKDGDSWVAVNEKFEDLQASDGQYAFEDTPGEALAALMKQEIEQSPNVREIPPDGIPVWVWNNYAPEEKRIVVSAGTINKKGRIECYRYGANKGGKIPWDHWESAFEMVPTLGRCVECRNVLHPSDEEPCKSCEIIVPTNFKSSKLKKI